MTDASFQRPAYEVSAKGQQLSTFNEWESAYLLPHFYSMLYRCLLRLTRLSPIDPALFILHNSFSLFVGRKGCEERHTRTLTESEVKEELDESLICSRSFDIV